MLIGIDVGGTYTDAALIIDHQVRKWVKIPTREDLLSSLLEALDELITEVNREEIRRVVLSTTLITNLIAEERAEKVALLALPGPGANPQSFKVFADAYIIKGAIDYRGREIEPLDLKELSHALEAIANAGIRKVAVVGKFSVRNNAHEEQIARFAAQNFPQMEVELGHKAAGKLNFPRRAATTRLTAATRALFRQFIEQVQAALLQRNIKAPTFILKADGGTIPIEKASEFPVETIFSGPAASTMGVLALTPPGQTSIVVDVGGTTTDLALILSGHPLLASKGAKIKEHLTQVRGFSVKSVPVGGDTWVKVENGQLVLTSQREGPARCLGGPLPTPTDALRVLGITDIGELESALEAMAELARQLSLTDSAPQKVAQKILDLVVDRITKEIESMFLEWEQEPAYRVWEVMQKKKVRPQNVVGVGGSAPALVPMVAKKLNCNSFIPPYAPVANAVGTAVARPTLSVTLRVDTERGVFTIAEDGQQGTIPSREKDRFHLEEAEAMARRLLQEKAEAMGLGEYSQEAEVTLKEVFNMIRGWSRVGRLLDVIVQITPGLIPGWTTPPATA